MYPGKTWQDMDSVATVNVQCVVVLVYMRQFVDDYVFEVGRMLG